MPYRHTQTNPWTLLLFVLIAAVIVPLYGWIGREMKIPIWLLLVTLGLIAALVVNFSVLTVQVSDRELTISFGLGVPLRRFARADIIAPRRATIPWWYGTGIKLLPSRTSYLVATGPAIAFELPSGRVIQVGSDDVDTLLVALRS